MKLIAHLISPLLLFAVSMAQPLSEGNETKPGVMLLPGLRGTGDGDDLASGGNFWWGGNWYPVVVYKNTNYGGSKRYAAVGEYNRDRLSQNGYDSEISSIKIDRSYGVKLCTGNNFGGCYTIYGNRADLDVLDNRVNSLKVFRR